MYLLIYLFLKFLCFFISVQLTYKNLYVFDVSNLMSWRDQDKPQEKEMKKAKWLSEEALQIAVKRRKRKSKGEKERYTHLNADSQSIARRDKKAFLRDQCKEIEENNRMGKTRDLFKKIRDTKGTFHVLNKGKKWYGPNRSRRY